MKLKPVNNPYPLQAEQIEQVIAWAAQHGCPYARLAAEQLTTYTGREMYLSNPDYQSFLWRTVKDD